MAEFIVLDDLPADVSSHELIDAMVAGANARAARVAPCLAGTGEDAPTVGQIAEARLVLVGAIKRWTEAGSGALASQTAGPFNQTIDTRQRTGFNLWPSEIQSLQAICASGSRRAYVVDMVPEGAEGHWAQPDLWVPLISEG